MSNGPLKSRVGVKWVYFHSKIEWAVVWHEAGEHTQLEDRKEEKKRIWIFAYLWIYLCQIKLKIYIDIYIYIDINPEETFSNL